MDKAKQVKVKDDVKYVPVKEEEIFGFNDPRYADMKLRLIVCHNDSPASTISETSECRGNLSSVNEACVLNLAIPNCSV